MELRQLGTSPVKVTPVVFGAWAIGGWMWGGGEDADAIDAIRASIDHGVNAVDTAAIYGMGHSEELVGRAIEGRRDKVVVASKCGMRWDTKEGSEPWPQKDNDGRDVTIMKNARPDSIRHECEESLKRLRVDVIDVYQIHWPDTSTPVEESIRAMEDLRRAGKIKAIGVSNYDVEWLRRATAAAPVACDQPPFSLINRKIEKDVLPFCREHHIGVIVYSPLERGLLAGMVPPDRQFPPGDHRATHKFFTPENRRKALAALEKIKPICDAHHASYAQTVVNWTMNEPGVTAAIVGARNARQAEHNAAAMRISLSPDERAKIRSAFNDLAASPA